MNKNLVFAFNRKKRQQWLAALAGSCLLLTIYGTLAQNNGTESKSDQRAANNNEVTQTDQQQNTQEQTQEETEKNTDDNAFTPSEEISEDRSVAFPVDI